MLRKYAAALAVTILAVAPAHAERLEDVQRRLSVNHNIVTEFIQQKEVKGMPIPLITKGTAVISKDVGVYWKQTMPFPMEFVVTDSFISQKMPGKKKRIIDKNSNHRLFQYASLLKSVTAYDFRALEGSFDVDFKSTGNKTWEISLRPLTEPLAKAFTQILIGGGDYLEEVVVADGKGDVTAVKFYNQQKIDQAAQVRGFFER